jgi:hypothetical protein
MFQLNQKNLNQKNGNSSHITNHLLRFLQLSEWLVVSSEITEYTEKTKAQPGFLYLPVRQQQKPR